MNSRRLPMGCSASAWACGMIKDIRRAWGFMKKTPRLRIRWSMTPPIDNTRSWKR